MPDKDTYYHYYHGRSYDYLAEDWGAYFFFLMFIAIVAVATFCVFYPNSCCRGDCEDDRVYRGVVRYRIIRDYPPIVEGMRPNP